MPYDPISEDPDVDPKFPSKLHLLFIDSNGSSIVGRLYNTHGREKHPIVILLHGIPGIELNLDLARVICRAEWNVVTFHYRGSWGCEGEFSIQNSIEDAKNVMSYLKQEEITSKYNLDTNNIVIIGLSFGGSVALHLAIHDASITNIASISGPDGKIYGNYLKIISMIVQMKKI